MRHSRQKQQEVLRLEKLGDEYWQDQKRLWAEKLVVSAIRHKKEQDARARGDY